MFKSIAVRIAQGTQYIPDPRAANPVGLCALPVPSITSSSADVDEPEVPETTSSTKCFPVVYVCIDNVVFRT